MSMITITKENFESEVLQSKNVILLDFWASWCGPCRMVSPILDEIEKESHVTIGKINVEEQLELAQAFQIMSIPTLIVIKDGKLVERSSGVKSKPAILSMMLSPSLT